MHIQDNKPGTVERSNDRLFRVCYLVTLYQKFDQALRMVRTLAGPNTAFVFHIDRSVDSRQVAAFRSALSDLDCVKFASRVRSKWGSYNGALAVVHCIETALKMPAFDRYILISGQHYPLVGQTKIADFFQSNSSTEYIEAYPLDVLDETAPGWSPHYRFQRYHVWIGNRRFTLPLIRKRKPPLKIFHGSTWWALTYFALIHLSRQFETNSAIRTYFRSSFLVEEAYIQTLMMASPLASNVSGFDVTYAEWTPTSGPHPKVLTSADFGKLLLCGKLYARKFDAGIDSTVLALLDQRHVDSEAMRSAAASGDSESKQATTEAA